MPTWETKALEWEMSALKHLDGFMDEHALFFLVGAIYLLLALSVWVLSGGLRRKLWKGKPIPHVRPVIVLQIPIGRPPAPPEPFNPFPPYQEPPDCDCDDYYED
jgi:hypothetical protein